MIDEETGKAIVQQMHQHWIGPELEARAKAGKLPEDFKVRRCLIRLPKDAKPIVEFNEEVVLTARAKVPPLTREVKAGDIALLDDIEYIERVYPPEVDGARVAFIYAHWVDGKYSVFFDLSPNTEGIPLEDGEKWGMGEAIGRAVHRSVIELALSVHESIQPELLGSAPATHHRVARRI